MIRPDTGSARWIWLPSERTLPNSVVLFRRDVEIGPGLLGAKGWVTAESRYRLTIDGRRVQWGPAPSDPRWPEADPLELGELLEPGRHTIGLEVLYYGHGDGTWVTGKPGLLFDLLLDYGDRVEEVASDERWSCTINRAYRPGQYKRWFLRALQEDVDARRLPVGWDTPGYAPGEEWVPALELDADPSEPALAGTYVDYLNDSALSPGEDAALVARSIPLMEERLVPVLEPVEAATVVWRRDPDDWFEFRVPGSLECVPLDRIAEGLGEWVVPTGGERLGHTLTFPLPEQLVGFPTVSVDAPDGTIIELIFQEGHDVGASPWLDTNRFRWARYTCSEGPNEFTAYDYESLKWIQIHVRGNTRPVVVHSLGVLRRTLPVEQAPRVVTSDTALARLLAACLNTVRNSAIDSVVDGHGRERQQYSGDVAHQLFTIRAVLGNTSLPARFLRTYSEGITRTGYFMDTWPAFDRTVRIAQRELGLSPWGPILDHGVQFVFDNWNHYWETGREEDLRESYPRLLVFAEYLHSLETDAGLMPVEQLGVPCVWIDHDGYREQRDKQCAFTLYVSAMLTHALAPLARLFGDRERAAVFEQRGESLREAAVSAFWDTERRVFVNNLPWTPDRERHRTCDRSLANAVLFDQCPEADIDAALEILAAAPSAMGLSYPPNAIWRYRALSRGGRIQTFLDEARSTWSRMPSVIANNSLSENFRPRADWYNQWSHAAIAPINIVFAEVAGIRALEPGYRVVQVAPQLGDVDELSLDFRTVAGTIAFEARRADDGIHDVVVTSPRHVELRTVSAPDVRIRQVTGAEEES